MKLRVSEFETRFAALTFASRTANVPAFTSAKLLLHYNPGDPRVGNWRLQSKQANLERAERRSNPGEA